MASHLLTARIERAMVVQHRRAYALHEAGLLDLETPVRREAELLSWGYIKYHRQQLDTEGRTDKGCVGSSSVVERSAR